MGEKRKFYVVWEGLQPGIYDSWDEAKVQIEGFRGAKFKSYPSLKAATEAFRSGDGMTGQDIARFLIYCDDEKKRIQEGKPDITLKRPAFPPGAIAVDAACSGNPGMMEYRGVEIESGRELFHVGPLPGGTNNIGEYLAIVHAFAMLSKAGVSRTVYSDSKIAIGWAWKRRSNTKVTPNNNNRQVLELLRRANLWMASHQWPGRLEKWKTSEWGEIPADFGRK